jgi:hypothetical protein
MKTNSIYPLLLLAGILIFNSANAQGIYFGFGGGYGFAAAQQTLQPDQTSKTNQYTNSTSSGSTTTVNYQSLNYSLGKGINLGLYGGYMLTKNFGLELGAGYLFGLTTTQTTETDKQISNTVSSPSYYSNSTDIATTTIKGSMLRLVPGVRFQFGERKIHPYASIGLIIGMMGNITSETTDNNSISISNTLSGPPPNSSDNIFTYSGRLSMGFHGSLGVAYMFSGRFGLFAELTGNYQNYKPGKSVRTLSTSNGKDNLPLMPESLKETDYSSSYSTTSGTGVPPVSGSPSQSPYQIFPFSSVGFTIGLHYTLARKE